MSIPTFSPTHYPPADETARWAHDLDQLDWALAPSDERRCTATSKTTGRRCACWTMKGNSRCANHTTGGRVYPRLPGVSAKPLVVAVLAQGVPVNRYSRATQRAFYRAKESGRVTLAAADQLAHDLLGEHPATLWGDAWWDAQH